MNHKNQVVHYYNTSHWLYQLLVYSRKSLGMHHGFWDSSTTNLEEAMLNENQEIIDLAKIIKHHKVLDAGCGVGGTVIYIAKKTEAHVTGITIVPKQIKLAKKYAKEKEVSHLTEFLLRNYTDTKFPNNSFDLIYGIESVCHAKSKLAFLKEAYRILKPGGIIIIADGYSSRSVKNEKERKIINDFNKAFALHELITPKQMTQALSQSNFINIKTFNKTEAVKPTIKHFYMLGKYKHPLTKLASLLPIGYLQAMDRHVVAFQSEQESIKIGLFAYYIHLAQKPK